MKQALSDSLHQNFSIVAPMGHRIQAAYALRSFGEAAADSTETLAAKEPEAPKEEAQVDFSVTTSARYGLRLPSHS